MVDRLASMAVLVKVAEVGSFTAAATALDVSAQMVGRHVQALEDHLGVRLINRSTRRQSLTEVGRTYVDRCRVVLSEVEVAEACAAEGRAIPRGKLRVDAPVTFGVLCLAPALPDYLNANPEVTVDLTLNNRVVDLVDEGYDAVIRTGPLADSGLIARQLAPYRFTACASPAYLDRHGAPGRPEDLATHACLGFVPGVPHGAWAFSEPDGRPVAIRSRGRLASNNGQVLREAALQGQGIILQPEALVRADLAAGRLLRVLPEYEPPSRPMHVVYAPGRRLTLKLRSFVDFVVRRFAP